MAIFHLSVKTISRASGRSATAAIAYRSAERIEDMQSGEVFDYTRKLGVEASDIFIPKDAPAWARNREQLWNKVEQSETRKNSTVAREFEIALPAELSKDQRRALVADFSRRLVEKHGIAVDAAIHSPDGLEQGGNKNHHAHLLTSCRRIGANGFGGKAREFDSLDGKALVKEWRQEWAKVCNQHLEMAGITERIDHRSNKEISADLRAQGRHAEAADVGQPTVKLGTAAAALENNVIATARGDENRTIRQENLRERDRAALGQKALEKLLDQQSVFTDRDLYRAISKLSDRRLGDDLHRTAASAVERTDVILLGTDAKGHVLMTTAKQKEMEQRMVSISETRRGEGLHQIDNSKIDSAAKKYNLSDEQSHALRHIGGIDGVAITVGMAGAGKTTMLSSAREAFQASGFTVRGAALSGAAAENLEKESRIKSQTVHSLLKGLDEGRDSLKKGDVLVIDEAGMLNSKLMARLVDHTSRTGSKLILVGDDRQLQPIQSGGAFALLKDRLGAVEMTQIRRQRDAAGRQTVHDFADGRAQKALQDLSKRGLVRVGVDDRDTKVRMVRDWHSDGGAGLMMAGTRKDVLELNNLARERRIANGEIKAGHTIQTEKGAREFSPGDSLLFLKNDRKIDVKNGTRAIVKSVSSSEMIVKTIDGREVKFDPRDYDKIDHGYAITVHKSQGQTVDKSYNFVGLMHDRELMYVSGSRHRDSHMMYIDSSKYTNIQKLAAQMSTSHKKGTTLDAQVAAPAPSKAELVQSIKAKTEEPQTARQAREAQARQLAIKAQQQQEARELKKKMEQDLGIHRRRSR